MPIIQCTLEGAGADPEGNPALMFAAEADIDVELVTVNVSWVRAQFGNAYRAVVQIVIPDMWDPASREQFITAAHAMLEGCFKISRADCIVYLTPIESGAVSDRGRIEQW